MERTPEQIRADERLNLAIHEHAVAYDLVEGGDLLGDWVVVSAWIDVEHPGRCSYVSGFPAGELPDHVARGLLHTGLVALDEPDDD